MPMSVMETGLVRGEQVVRRLYVGTTVVNRMGRDLESVSASLDLSDDRHVEATVVLGAFPMMEHLLI